MKLRKGLAAVAVGVALIAGNVAVGSASAASAPTSKLQQKIDAYLSGHPDARQTGTNTLAIPGGALTMGAAPNAALLSCGSGHLCIQDGTGELYDYYYCGLYSFDGIGDGVFNNNQTSGTVAKFYNTSSSSVRWTNTAKDTGTASWTPVYWIRPC